jgi:hypothetical protein
VKIVCLHDADPAGYLIGHDLATNMPRFMDTVDVKVIDVGLTIRESIQMGLQDEPFELIKAKDGDGRFGEWTKIRNMRKIVKRNPDGTRSPLLEEEAWDAFMPTMVRGNDKPTWVSGAVEGRRVELNAMAPRQFIDWLERHLEANDCQKVRPPDDVVDEKIRSARENLVRNEVGTYLMDLLGHDAVMNIMREVGVPSYDLDSVLEGRPEQHWSYLCEKAGQSGMDLKPILDRVLKARLAG